MEPQTHDNQPIEAARCHECGQASPEGAGAAPCLHCGFAADGSMLALHGWAAKRLHGFRLPRVLLGWGALCFMIAVPVQNAMLRYLGFSVPYVGALVISGMVAFLISWPNRWPRIPVGAPAQWHLRLAREGFAVRLGPGPVTVEPWSQVERVRVRRPRPGVCWIRIVRSPVRRRMLFDYAVDLVVTCEDEMIGQVRECIAAWREGRPARAPSLGVSSQDPRAAARTAQGRTITTLAIEQCPQCDYDLVGLPERGQCPECGFEYDGETLIVLYGWNGRGLGLMSPFRWGMILFLAVFLASLVGGMLGPRLGLSRTLLQVGLIYALLFPLAVWSRFRRRSFSDPNWKSFGAPNKFAIWQLRLAPNGFGLRTGHGPCNLRPWSDQTHLHLDLKEGNAHRVRITNSPEPSRSGREWVRLDLDCDATTAGQVLERVSQWRQAGR